MNNITFFSTGTADCSTTAGKIQQNNRIDLMAFIADLTNDNKNRSGFFSEDTQTVEITFAIRIYKI